MSFQKFKFNSFCVGGRHRSTTTNIYGDITSEGSKVLIGLCSNCIGKKSVTVSDNTMVAGGLGEFFMNLGKNGLNVSKKMAKNVLKNPGRALEIRANVGSASASRSPKAALSSLPEVIIFYHTGKGLRLCKFVLFMLYKWNKNTKIISLCSIIGLRPWFRTEIRKKWMMKIVLTSQLITLQKWFFTSKIKSINQEGKIKNIKS